MECDLLIGWLQVQRARATALDLEAVARHVDIVLGSLTRVRVALIEGREIDMRFEVAAIKAAEEQITMERSRGAD